MLVEHHQDRFTYVTVVAVYIRWGHRLSHPLSCTAITNHDSLAWLQDIYFMMLLPRKILGGNLYI
jgi:hypothetical protein